MLNRIFSFTSSAKNTLIQRFTIKAHVLTLYSGVKHHFYATSENFSIFYNKIMQPSAKCGGTKLESLQDHQSEHDINNPHIDAIEAEVQHVHLMTCDLITPNDLKSILATIKEIQNDKAGRQAYAGKIAQLNKLTLELREGSLGWLLGTEKRKDYDTTSDYLSDEDFTNLYNEFEAYFKENEQQLREQHQQIQNDLTWTNRIGWNALKSAGYAAAYAGLAETLVANGVKKEKAEWFMHGLAYALQVVGCLWATGTVPPLLFGVATLATIIKFLKLEKEIGDNKALLSNIIVTAVVPTALQYGLSNGFAFLNLGVSLLSSFGAAFASHSLTQSFWSYIKSNGNAQALSPAQPTSASVARLKAN